MKNFEIKSLNGRNLLIKIDAAIEKTDGGIILPESAKKTLILYSTAEVVDIGNDVPEGKYTIGDKVMLTRYRAEDRPYKINGQELYIVAEGHVIATIE